jgi:hypothetical protein
MVLCELSKCFRKENCRRDGDLLHLRAIIDRDQDTGFLMAGPARATELLAGTRLFDRIAAPLRLAIAKEIRDGRFQAGQFIFERGTWATSSISFSRGACARRACRPQGRSSARADCVSRRQWPVPSAPRFWRGAQARKIDAILVTELSR